MVTFAGAWGCMLVRSEQSRKVVGSSGSWVWRAFLQSLRVLLKNLDGAMLLMKHWLVTIVTEWVHVVVVVSWGMSFRHCHEGESKGRVDWISISCLGLNEIGWVGPVKWLCFVPQKYFMWKIHRWMVVSHKSLTQKQTFSKAASYLPTAPQHLLMSPDHPGSDECP